MFGSNRGCYRMNNGQGSPRKFNRCQVWLQQAMIFSSSQSHLKLSVITSWDCHRLTVHINSSNTKCVNMSWKLCKRLHSFIPPSVPTVPRKQSDFSLMQVAMEDSIDVIVEDHTGVLSPFLLQISSSSSSKKRVSVKYIYTHTFKFKKIKKNTKYNLHINCGLLTSEQSALSLQQMWEGNKTVSVMRHIVNVCIYSWRTFSFVIKID